VDDLLDQLQCVVRALAEADERNVRLLARRHRPDLADLDLGGDHLVPHCGDELRDLGEPILTLAGDEHARLVQDVAAA
jgi:hypothetical protein